MELLTIIRHNYIYFLQYVVTNQLRVLGAIIWLYIKI
jgi:hypothetical protein